MQSPSPHARRLISTVLQYSTKKSSGIWGGGGQERKACCYWLLVPDCPLLMVDMQGEDDAQKDHAVRVEVGVGCLHVL